MRPKSVNKLLLSEELFQLKLLQTTFATISSLDPAGELTKLPSPHVSSIVFNSGKHGPYKVNKKETFIMINPSPYGELVPDIKPPIGRTIIRP